MSSRTMIPISAHPEVGKISEADYLRLYQHSLDDPDGFWGEHGNRLDWIKPYTNVKDASFDGDVRIAWYEDGTLNACYNCVDRHLPRRGEQTAILWEGDDPGEDRHITYRELHEAVCRFANVLKERGVQKGRSGHDLSADDPGDRGGGAGLRADRRRSFGRVRRVFAGQPCRAHPRLPLDLSGDRRRGAARRPHRAAQAQRRCRPRKLPRRARRDRGPPHRRRRQLGSRAATSGITRHARRPRPTARRRKCRPRTRCLSFTPRARPGSPKGCCTRPAAISSMRR